MNHWLSFDNVAGVLVIALALSGLLVMASVGYLVLQNQLNPLVCS